MVSLWSILFLVAPACFSLGFTLLNFSAGSGDSSSLRRQSLRPQVVSWSRSLNFEDDGASPCDIQSGCRTYQVTLLSLGDFMFFISCVLIVSEYKNSLLTLETDGTSSTGVTFSSLLSFSPWESSVKC